jgi:hypothetical protein
LVWQHQTIVCNARNSSSTYYEQQTYFG